MIRIGDLQLGTEERAALQTVIDSGRITEWREVRAFEEEFAAWVGVRHCVAVSSGTAALMVGLAALRLDPRYDVRRVLVPALTFIATANAVTLSGLEPAFGDITPGLTLDPAELRRLRYDAVLPVHLFGYPADMDALRANAWAGRNIPILEDACEAHGTTYRGQMAGSIGLWGAFSFYVAHTIQAGELGAFVTDDAELAQMARRLKAHGRRCACRLCTRNTTGCPVLERGDPDPRFTAIYPGWNFKPMEFQAALARVQLRHAQDNIDRRREHVARLTMRLAQVEDYVDLPAYHDHVAYMAYPLVLRVPGIRDRVVAELARRGVESRPMFGCIPTQQPAYASYRDSGMWPVADRVGANGFYVGCHQYLTGDEVDEMARTIVDVVKSEAQA
jgi:dTDP-4-amino-4,6-dideoxygalactose transaminase